MTPERLQEIREWGQRNGQTDHFGEPRWFRHEKELLVEVDRLRAENALLRQGRGGTPETHVADDRTPLHLTHPIENSQEN